MTDPHDGSFDLDTQFIEHRLSAVTPSRQSDGPGWSLTFEDGFGLYCPGDACPHPPEPGETARLYGRGFGYTVRGLVIAGRVYYYRTEAGEAARHAAWVEAEHAQRETELDQTRADRDRRRAALPPPLRERIEGFAAARPNWRRDHEGYELFVCEEAAKLAAFFSGDVAGLRAFWSASLEDKKARCPDLAYAEHSGNTWGAACMLAGVLLEHPERAPQVHGALCPLVGCQEYGCFAARSKGEVQA